MQKKASTTTINIFVCLISHLECNMPKNLNTVEQRCFNLVLCACVCVLGPIQARCLILKHWQCQYFQPYFWSCCLKTQCRLDRWPQPDIWSKNDVSIGSDTVTKTDQSELWDQVFLLNPYLIWAAVIHPVLSMAVKAAGASERRRKKKIKKPPK